MNDLGFNLFSFREGKIGSEVVFLVAAPLFDIFFFYCIS